MIHQPLCDDKGTELNDEQRSVFLDELHRKVTATDGFVFKCAIIAACFVLAASVTFEYGYHYFGSWKATPLLRDAAEHINIIRTLALLMLGAFVVHYLVDSHHRNVEDSVLEAIASYDFLNEPAYREFLLELNNHGAVPKSSVLQLIHSERLHLRKVELLEKPGASAILLKNRKLGMYRKQ